MYILVDKETKKILDFSDLELFACEGRFVVEEDIDDVANILDSIYEDGKIIFKQELKAEAERQRLFNEEYDAGIEVYHRLLRTQVLATASDSDAYVMRYLYDQWQPGMRFEEKDIGTRLMYQDQFYKVLQPHTATAEWTPDVAVSLYVEVSDSGIEYPAWKMPSGAHDSYDRGSKVTHLGHKFISEIDGNTTEPSLVDYRFWKLVE